MSRYEIRVKGHLDPHRCAWLGDLELVRHSDGTSTLTGLVADQAELYGLLTRLRDMGATLLLIRDLGAPDRFGG
ncbi:hypothetical protein [Tenggerimyces flavus]|uniref:Uncharacterized protein n=1 Tax=Tenggerimyces flavus TaxID=1708749 RepID=A0ABV7YCA4_9ACTN|nr:hypothetical protein [Tenggerimyces flavus]MBM7789106.1 hypothetical protein [Tenggerimyces flavus]